MGGREKFNMDERGEDDMKKETAIAVMWQARECWQPQSLEGARNGVSAKASGGGGACHTRV